MGDFNGDLQTDVFLTLARKFDTYMAHVDPNTIQADIQIGPIVPGITAFMFESADSVEIKILSTKANQNNFTLHIGSDSVRQVTGYQDFWIDPNEDAYQGIQEVGGGQAHTHIFIGRVDGKWKIQASNLSSKGELGISIQSQTSISEFETFYTPVATGTKDELYVNSGNYNFTQVPLPELNDTDKNQMGVAGDFDNDMDLDIYVLCGTGAQNGPSYLLENINNQSWVRHDEDGFGAVNTGKGIADAVTVADYDNDGFLDLFVSNGQSLFFLDSAGYKLYRNQGNANHWLGIDLVGVTDTRGGYGAVVYAVAGGVKQVRTQNGGEHHKSKNDQRIHFGMGANTEVDSIIVKWPDGETQVLTNVAVDQYLDVLQSGGTVRVTGLSDDLEHLSIFPNPATNWFGLKTNYSGDAHLRIFDLTGKMVDEFNMHFTGHGNDVVHPISLVPGIYSMEFAPRDRSGRPSKTMKLVVQ